MSRENQFAMNLIRNNRNAVTDTDFTDTYQFLTSPHTPGWIMRIAQQHHFHFRVGSLTLQILIIDRKRIAGQGQRRRNHHAPVITNRRKETIIDRSLHQHLIARDGQSLDDCRHGRDYARRVNNPFPVDHPPMPARKPPRNRLVITVGDTGVTKNAMFHSPAQSVDNGRCCGEIHIGDPHRQYTFACCTVPFIRIGSPSRNGSIEIVFHISPV